MMFSNSRMLFVLSAVVGVVGNVTIVSAQNQPIVYQLRGERADLPPHDLLSMIWDSPSVVAAACKSAGLEFLGREFKGGVGSVINVRLPDGEEGKIVCTVIHFPDNNKEDALSAWGSITVYPYEIDPPPMSQEKLAKLWQASARVSEALLEQVQQVFAHFGEDVRIHEIDAQRRVVDDSDRRWQEAGATLAKLRVEAAEFAKQASLPAAVLEKQLSDGLTQLQALQIEASGLEARRAVLELQIAKLSEKAAAVLADDEVLRNLQRVIELRSREVDIVKTQIAAARANPRDLEGAEVQLATAQAELAEARRDAAKSQGGGATEQLQLDLVQTIVKLEEGRAKQKFIEKRISEYQRMLEIQQQHVQPILDMIPSAQRRVDALDHEKIVAESELERIKNRQQEVVVRRLDPPADAPELPK